VRVDSSTRFVFRDQGLMRLAQEYQLRGAGIGEWGQLELFEELELAVGFNRQSLTSECG